jgi:L-iditol 2-dehydrogenase
VSLEEGAMCEPLSVGVHACRRANIGPETNVLIMGAGPIGLVTMLSARAFGAPRIVVVDVDDHRLSVAKSLGADDIVKVSTNIQVYSIRRFLISSIFSPLTRNDLLNSVNSLSSSLCNLYHLVYVNSL